jgi:hypothetical protein
MKLLEEFKFIMANKRINMQKSIAYVRAGYPNVILEFGDTGVIFFHGKLGITIRTGNWTRQQMLYLQTSPRVTPV